MGLIDLQSSLILADSVDDMKHELAHAVCGHSWHDNQFKETHAELGGSNAIYDVVLDKRLAKIGIAANVGNVTGVQNILLDYHLLQAYRKFSARILGTEGRWEVLGDNKIRLYPTPRGSFPVIVKYFPIINRFKTVGAHEVTKRMLVAEAKIILGNIRSKFGAIPSPDGGSIQMNGDAMRTEGMEEKKQALEDAILLGEPNGIFLF